MLIVEYGGFVKGQRRTPPLPQTSIICDVPGDFQASKGVVPPGKKKFEKTSEYAPSG